MSKDKNNATKDAAMKDLNRILAENSKHFSKKTVDEVDAPNVAEKSSGQSTEDSAADSMMAASDESNCNRQQELEDEIDQLKDRLMRSLAESENQRKRAERDRCEAEIYGGRRLARDLLSVYDNLKRALQTLTTHQDNINESLLTGINLTQRELINVFARHKIILIDAQVGARFNPEIHEAMYEAKIDDIAAGCIAQVMTDGFMIANRLLRPAQVGVSSGTAVVENEEKT